MAGRIPQSFIDDLIARADIIDVVGARVPLKKRGKEYIACCPFHNEKTPSFTVNQSKQFYHCFGCGAHGTALGFVMEFDRLEFVDAVESLAATYHLEVPREQGETKPDDRGPLYELLNQAADAYRAELKNSPRAVQYLKGRGLSGDVAKTFSLGYAPDSWDFLSQTLISSPHPHPPSSRDDGSPSPGTGEGKSVSLRDLQISLLRAGMLIEKAAGKYYDRFRDRIMFPIRDRRGRIIGFGGRILDKGEPKYLNSPETPLFHKGQELYGLYEAQQASHKLTRIMVVEGYMDVVALAQHGITYAVATLGTATSSEQISRIFRVVPEVIFCFDGDRAGRAAAWKALENALPVLSDGVQARFLFLPDTEDPDSLVRKEGREAFEQRLLTAQPLSDFLLDHLASQTDMSSMDGRARLAELARPLIGKLGEGVFRELLSAQLAQRVGLSLPAMQQHLPAAPPPQQQLHPERAQRPVKQQQPSRHQVQVTPLRLAIALLLQHPQLARQQALPAQLAQSAIPGIELLFSLHQVILQTENVSSSALIERWRDSPEQDALQKLLGWDIPDSADKAQRDRLFSDALNKLALHHTQSRFEQLLEKSHLSGLSAEEKAELRRLSSLNNTQK
ncbi:MAG TPA: DNA primase [Gammaproteobacteria bacterium]|nr:DNA primase [Gammaproteobacteria bacterium]